MTYTLTLVVYMAAITWALLLVASLIRARGWTMPGMMVAMGNRENLPEPSAFAGRAERTARNTLDNFAIFAALVLVAHVAGKGGPLVDQGAAIFFWARIAFIPLYYAGIPYLRTIVWTIGFIGQAMIACALL